MKDSFIFYRSFAEAISHLPKKHKLILLEAIISYSLDGKLNSLSGVPEAMFALIRPQLDANRVRFENGMKGGRPSTEIKNIDKPLKNNSANITETKPNHNLDVTKPKPNVNVNDNVNVNNNLNVNLNELGFPKNKNTLFDEKRNILYEDEFKPLMSLYPTRAGGNSEIAAYRVWLRLIESKEATPEELQDSVIRYQKYCAAMGRIGTEYVMTAKKFFEDQYYKEKWEAPHETSKRPEKFDPAKYIFGQLAESIERDKAQGAICPVHSDMDSKMAQSNE